MRTRASSGLFVLLASTFHISALFAQDPTTRVDARGRVVDFVTGDPIPDLHLHMLCSTKRGGPGGEYDAVTGDRGAFTFKGVPADFCAISAAGLALSIGNSMHTNGTENSEPWVIRVKRPAQISGRVTDQDGMPLAGALVLASVTLQTIGERVQRDAGNQYSDQEGRFHFEVEMESTWANKVDGYRVCARRPMQSTGPQVVYPQICFPGLDKPAATGLIGLSAGASKEVNLQLTPVAAGRVTGNPVLPSQLQRTLALGWVRSN